MVERRRKARGGKQASFTAKEQRPPVQKEAQSEQEGPTVEQYESPAKRRSHDSRESLSESSGSERESLAQPQPRARRDSFEMSAEEARLMLLALLQYEEGEGKEDAGGK